MKRRTKWIVGITTTILTVIGLNAAIGSRYRMHRGFHDHQSCMYDKGDRENKPTPSTGTYNDSTNRR